MKICKLEDIVPDAGVCALVNGRQVAVFRVEDRVYAIDNFDPFSKANVLSRGIVGDLKGELVVASPVYKQHFSLTTGQCLEDPEVHITVYPAAVEEGQVVVREPVKKKTETRSTCCYCGVGCGVIVESEGHQVTGVRGDPEHPANFGRLCTKGAALHLTMEPSYRLLHPEVRMRRDEARRRASWDDAMALAAERFRQCIAEHGPDSVAFYVSGQLLTEDYYVFNKLAKGLVGTNNIDTNSRLCMSSAVAGYKLSLGVDAPPCCYEDIEAADVILIAGSNTAFAHPVLYRRIEDARAANPHLKVIVIDPRATVTARAADLHLALKPGTDVALFNAMLLVMWREGLFDQAYLQAHTEGFAALEPLLRYWTPRRAAQVCELPVEKIFEAARLFASAGAALSLYCQGLNQSANGTYKNSALINLHLATGQIGRPGAGPFSLTGQPNAMGGREVGGMANLLPAHRDLASEQDRMEVARLWSVPAIPAKAGKSAVELFQSLERGDVRMVWIAGTNPAQSMPDAGAVRRALAAAEFVVVQDAFRDGETCDYADVLLPAAGWAEKEGTVTNSERRISRVRAAVRAPGEARADWQIAVDLAHRLGGEKLFPYLKPEDIFNEHRATTRGRDLDITGLSYSLLERKGPQQWGSKRLYTDGRFPTPSGRARFVATQYVPPREEVDDGFPLRLNTGRLRDHWHTMTRTGTAARFFSHAPQPEVLLHPRDMASLGIKDGELVRLLSRRGTTVMKGRASDEMRPGDAFVAMHWGSRFTSGAGANALTLPAIDPISKQPELKHAAIGVERFEPRWRRTLSAPASAELQRSVAPYLQRLDYAALTLDGGRFVLDVACADEPDARVLAVLESLFAPVGAQQPPRAICACLEVTEDAVHAAIAAGATLARLQSELKAGTQCGACVPELRCLLRPAVTALPEPRSGSARRAP